MKRILILEDDLETLSVLLGKLAKLEKAYEASGINGNVSVMVISEYTQVEEYINNGRTDGFDAVLLGRDCKLGDSFHILNITGIGPEKVISISSVPGYNDEAVTRGVETAIWKNYQDLEGFSDRVINELKKILSSGLH